ncbi:MAG: tyrosine-type recombinase/integrase [Azospirillum sp.]|nr:tyrosine-type recombinase/integrase [Azospirillum sp.]
MNTRVYEEISQLKQGLGNQLVFPSRNGNKIEHISRTFKRVVKAVGLNNGISDRRQKIVFHSLRHTFASRLVQKGVSLYEVKELLGHTDIKMTKHLATIHVLRNQKYSAVPYHTPLYKDTTTKYSLMYVKFSVNQN